MAGDSSTPRHRFRTALESQGMCYQARPRHTRHPGGSSHGRCTPRPPPRICGQYHRGSTSPKFDLRSYGKLTPSHNKRDHQVRHIPKFGACSWGVGKYDSEGSCDGCREGVKPWVLWRLVYLVPVVAGCDCFWLFWLTSGTQEASCSEEARMPIAECGRMVPAQWTYSAVATTGGVNVFPRALVTDQLGLVQGVQSLGQGKAKRSRPSTPPR